MPIIAMIPETWSLNVLQPFLLWRSLHSVCWQCWLGADEWAAPAKSRKINRIPQGLDNTATEPCQSLAGLKSQKGCSVPRQHMVHTALPQSADEDALGQATRQECACQEAGFRGQG